MSPCLICPTRETEKLYNFPKDDFRKWQWIQFVANHVANFSLYTFNEKMRICARHFEEKCFIKTYQGSRTKQEPNLTPYLTPFAVPTLPKVRTVLFLLVRLEFRSLTRLTSLHFFKNSNEKYLLF